MDKVVNKLPVGFTCISCNAFNKYSKYVYAHWWFLLKTKCEQCQRPYKIIVGRASPAKRRKGDPKWIEW